MKPYGSARYGRRNPGPSAAQRKRDSDYWDGNHTAVTWLEEREEGLSDGVTPPL